MGSGGVAGEPGTGPGEPGQEVRRDVLVAFSATGEGHGFDGLHQRKALLTSPFGWAFAPR